MVDQQVPSAESHICLQVPGEMFSLAMEAKQRGRGVVGSTSNILDFIADNVNAALAQPFTEPLQVKIRGIVVQLPIKLQYEWGEGSRYDNTNDVRTLLPYAVIKTVVMQLWADVSFSMYRERDSC